MCPPMPMALERSRLARWCEETKRDEKKKARRLKFLAPRNRALLEHATQEIARVLPLGGVCGLRSEEIVKRSEWIDP